MIRFLYHLVAMIAWGVLSKHFKSTGADTYLLVIALIFFFANAWLAILAAHNHRRRA